MASFDFTDIVPSKARSSSSARNSTSRRHNFCRRLNITKPETSTSTSRRPIEDLSEIQNFSNRRRRANADLGCARSLSRSPMACSGRTLSHKHHLRRSSDRSCRATTRVDFQLDGLSIRVDGQCDSYTVSICPGSKITKSSRIQLSHLQKLPSVVQKSKQSSTCAVRR